MFMQTLHIIIINYFYFSVKLCNLPKIYDKYQEE